MLSEAGLKLLRDTIKDCLNSHHSSLKVLLQESLDVFAAMVYDDPPNQETTPSFETIMMQFKSKMDFKDLDGIRTHCDEFFNALIYLRHEEAAVWIREDLLQKLNVSLTGFVFNLKKF